jgi:hypothetical protein
MVIAVIIAATVPAVIVVISNAVITVDTAADIAVTTATKQRLRPFVRRSTPSLGAAFSFIIQSVSSASHLLTSPFVRWNILSRSPYI